MPLAAPQAGQDTSELAAPGQVAAPDLPAANDGTGANGPKYSALDVWAAAARQTIIGQGVQNAQLAAQTGADRSMADADYNAPPAPIPTEMLPYKDKYVGLQTQEEVAYRTAQIKAELRDQQTVSSSKLGFVAALGLGVSDPVALASLAVPMGGEGVAVSRIAMAVRMAGVGGAVSAADEAILHQMDPTHTWQGALTNVGAGTIISGILGGIIRPHVPPAEMERLRTNLTEDFTRPVASAPASISGQTDSATQIAQDIRTRLQEHVANLQTQASGAQGADLEAIRQRVAEAQTHLQSAGEALSPEARAAEVAAESERLGTPQSVRERLDATYGERAPEVLAARAESAVAARESDSAAAREVAQRNSTGAQADLARLQESQSAAAELERIQQIIRPGRPDLEAAPLPAGAEGTPARAPAEDPAGGVVQPQGGQAVHPIEELPGIRHEVEEATGEHTVHSENGATIANEASGRLSVVSSITEGAGAGRGQGTDRLERLAMEARTRGLTLASDISVSPAQARVYEKLKARGYDVRQNPDAKVNPETGNLVSNDPRRPVFEVPPPAPGAAAPAVAEAPKMAQAIARAPSPQTKRAIGDTVLQGQLREMAAQGGWETEGGKLLRDVDGNPKGRTAWIPNAQWWPGRPGGYNTQEVKRIVEKAIAGEKLGPKQQLLIDYMADVADGRVTNDGYMPRADVFEGLDHLDPSSVRDANEVAMVTRLSLIDEEALDNLARRFEDDDVGFMRGVKEVLDGHDTDAGLARSGSAERETPGEPVHGTAAERAAGPAERARIESPAAPGGREANGGGDAGGGAPGDVEREARLRAAGFQLANPEELAAHTAAARTSMVSRLRAQSDLFGVKAGAQELADETRRRDAARNSGQQSLETGRADDLFSQAARQVDIAQALKVLPESDRAAFEARLAALEPAPITSAPGDSTAGAMQAGRQISLQDLTVARGGRVLGKTLGWFAPGSRVLRSPSLEVRKAAIALVETPEMLEMNIPTPERPFGLATPAAVETLLKRWEGAWAQAFKARDGIYREYRARPMTPQSPEVGVTADHLTRREFNEEVSKAMRRGDAHPIPEVAKAAQATRRLAFDPLKVEAQHLGMLPKQAELDLSLRGTAESYLMRQYDRAKINADQVGWHQKLVDGFRAQMLEDGSHMDAAEATDVAHQVTRSIMGVETGLMDYNENIFGKVIPQSGRLKERTLALPDAHLEDYLVNDIDSLSHSYLKSLAPQVEVTKRFGDKDMTQAFQDIRDEYAVLSQRALAAGDNQAANKVLDRQNADVRDLQAMRDRLYGIFGVPSDPSNWFMRASRVLRSVNAFRMLGTATWSHIPDLANVVMRRGLIGTMGTAAKLSSSLDALKLNRAELQRMGTALDMIHNSTAAMLGEFGVESSYALQKALNRGTRAFTIATLETPWIATVKALAGAGAQDELLSAAQRATTGQLSRIERIRFNQAGVSQELLEQIASEFATHGKTVNGLRFGMSDKWANQNAAQQFEASINRHAEASTLSPSKGDTPLYTSTEWGKALFQFKTFGAVAIRKVVTPMAQGIAHADLRSASGLATLIAAGAATYTMKQKLSGQPIEKDPTRYALEVLDKSNLLGWTSEYFYPALWAGGMQNFSRWGDRQTWETLGGPVAGTAVDLWDLRLPAKIRAQLSGEGAGFTRADIHRIRRMLPGNQVWYLRRAVNNLEGYVGDEMGLPPEAPKGSTE